MRRKEPDLTNCLKASAEIRIRFSEVDSMSVVWHGNYVRFFEDAREAFGKKYGIGYMDIFANEYVAPLISIHCDYIQSLKYEDTAVVDVYFMDTPAAKIHFIYHITNKETQKLVATGETIQVFLSTSDNQLCLSLPPFFEKWKKKVGLIKA